MPTIADLLTHSNQHFPLSRAESWDKVGLQIGDANASASKVLLAHEVNDAVLDEAADFDALVIYHPLIFRPLDNLNFASHTARLAARCIRENINVIALHTAMDNADPPHALGDQLAQQLDLKDVKVLSPSGSEALYKVIVFTPPEAMENVSNAMWEAGAGHIGNYENTSFRARGVGTFRPLEGSNPYSGKLGELENADEWRLETIVPEANKNSVINAMLRAHPYEEVAYDVIRLENKNPKSTFGAARSGELTKPLTLDQLVLQVQQQLNPPGMRMVRGAKSTFHKVACVPGSGASFIKDAANAGCDCLITGDIKHHDALEAQALGLSIIDVTHAATETAAVEMMKSTFTAMPEIEVRIYDKSTNPFEHI